jgi:hypothetical protein
MVKEVTTVSSTTRTCSTCQYPDNHDYNNRIIKEHGQQPADHGEQAKGQMGFLRYNDQCLLKRITK